MTNSIHRESNKFVFANYHHEPLVVPNHSLQPKPQRSNSTCYVTHDKSTYCQQFKKLILHLVLQPQPATPNPQSTTRSSIKISKAKDK